MRCKIAQIAASDTRTDSYIHEPVEGWQDLENNYPDRFQGIGRFPGKFPMTRQRDALPRSVPLLKHSIQLKDEIKVGLDKLETINVLKKHTSEGIERLGFCVDFQGKRER